VASGIGALSNNTAGSFNTATGVFALQNNTNSYNTAIGADALGLNTSGSDNTATGYAALYYNTNGQANTASGCYALFYNTSGLDNTASGYYALLSNTSGTDNTAYGPNSLYQNTTENYNTANGVFSLNENTIGSCNTAVGYGALFDNTNNDYNAAVGYQSLRNSIGSNNVALGYQAGYQLTTGSSNIDIGNAGVAGGTATIRIGAEQTNTYIAGVYGTTISGGAAVYVDSSGQLGVLSSSARFKQNVQSMGDASDVLLSLHPVKFQYKQSMDPKGTPQFGLVAEEVEKIDPDLVVRDAKNQVYTVRYEAVNAMLLNEFLKQHQTVEEQKTEIATLENRLNELEKAVQSSTKAK
jgi:Chaperone of endosialidase